MKIEIMNINFYMKKLQHITSEAVKEIKMKNSKMDSVPAMLAYIEEYAAKNGFEFLNGAPAGNSIHIYLVKK
ncbi:MAG: hypothetical protein ACTSRK_10540 [Promethearchaeota archaeon]